MKTFGFYLIIRVILARHLENSLTEKKIFLKFDMVDKFNMVDMVDMVDMVNMVDKFIKFDKFEEFEKLSS